MKFMYLIILVLYGVLCGIKLNFVKYGGLKLFIVLYFILYILFFSKKDKMGL